MRTYEDLIEAIRAKRTVVFDLNNVDFSMFDDCFVIDQIRFDQTGVFVRKALPMLDNGQVANYDQAPSAPWYRVRRGPEQFETKELLEERKGLSAK